MKMFSKMAIAAAASLVVGAAQAAVIIDLFNGFQGPIAQGNSADPLLWAAQYGPDATVQGLHRDLAVKKTNTFGDPSGPDPSFGGTRASVAGGSFNWSVDAGVQALAAVRWDGAAAGGPAGTLTAQGGVSNHFLSSNLDFTGFSPALALNLGDAFIFDVIVSDLDFTFWFELYDKTGNFSKYKLQSQAHFAMLSTPIPVAAFAAQCLGGPSEFGDPTDADNDDVIAGICSSAAFDINNLGAIQIILESDPNGGSVDLRVNAIRVLPEPGSLALVGLGLLGAAGAGMRRRRA